MAADHEDDDHHKPYEVGYGKPPKATQFKRGQSGNQKGRPKGARNLGSLIEEALRRKVSIKDDGKERRIRMSEAIITQLFMRAARGDRKPLERVMELLEKYDATPGEWTHTVEIVFMGAKDGKPILGEEYKELGRWLPADNKVPDLG